ncbi:FadR/GntR family transcriptional regulator [Aurantimonas sp. Leaf443]|uniref:FadR/GntR family transcriptional regulator n=1 Tax=Aurantimonas sp. Leaf443 TaxID=1736378 RepID=UPI0006F55C4A|nr:FadR/GntR family transcriptional regulator [Aurantimonas sp. Leaf443]KQT88181.1 GntR family transcriptional regulator [Aurantimonas sp. Leaf443]
MGLLASALGGRAPKDRHAHVVGALGREIVGGQFAVGSILPNDKELSARFEVSRTVLREAMKTLQEKKLVQPKARVGTRVLEASCWNLLDPDILRWRVEAGLDETFLTDLAVMRLAFEPAAAELAAQRASPADVARLYEIADRFADPGHTLGSFAGVDLEFHLAIAEASQNPFMRSITSLIEAALLISFKLSSPAADLESLSRTAALHRAIVEAIEAGDGAGARAAMVRVIDIGAERVRRVLPLQAA